MRSTLVSLPRGFEAFRVSLWRARPPSVGLGVLLVLIMALLSAACGQSEPEIVAVSGRSLEVYVTEPQLVDKAAYVDSTGQYRVIRPRATNRQLAMVNVTVVNRTSLFTPMLIDSDAARLGDRRGERINAVDPFEASMIVDEVDPETELYDPFLWGEVELDKNFQVEGWMVFDVPKGMILGTFWWEEVDHVVADYIEYRQRRR